MQVHIDIHTIKNWFIRSYFGQFLLQKSYSKQNTVKRKLYATGKHLIDCGWKFWLQ